MKLTKSQLEKIIKEEVNNINKGELLLEHGPQVIKAFQPIIDLYDMANDEDKEQLENNMIEVFKNIVKDWRQNRENPDAWKSGY